MDERHAQALIEKYRELIATYHEAASAMCHDNQPYEVYQHVKEALAMETKVRRIKNRYLSK
jgi:aminoglycoside phosphotransferase (APT) family kinase protein